MLGGETSTFSYNENLSSPFPRATLVLKCTHYGTWCAMSYEWHSHILALLVLFPRSVKESWLLGWKQVHACSQRDTASSKTVREARDKRGEVTALSRGYGIGSPSSATFLILPSLEWVVCHHELQEKRCNSSQLLARIPRWSMDVNIHPSIMRCIAMRDLSSQLLSLARGVEMWC